MSYILDALRRADSERERGAVPGLHSKQMPDLADVEDGEPAKGSAQRLWWAVGLLAVALVGMVVWMVLGRSTPELQPMAPLARPEPQTTHPPPSLITQAPLEPPVAQSPAVTEAAPERKSMPSTTGPRVASTQARATAVPKVPKAAEKVGAAVASGDDEAPVPSISELPDELRRQLPSLGVGGASYSKNPASRMLILNGQVFKEGDKVANDLVLEQIRLKSAVLSFKGKRYSISF